MDNTNGKWTFFDRLDNHYNKLSKKQIRLAEYLRTSYKSAIFLNSVPLGKMAGVSDATVIRFAQELGYTGFTDMMNDVKELVKFEMSAAEKFSRHQETRKKGDVFEQICESNGLISKRLRNYVSAEQIYSIVHEIMTSKKVIVCTFESLAGLGEFLVYHLQRCGCRAEVVSEKTGNLFTQYNSVDEEGTYFITLDFMPYVKNQIKITKEFSKKKGVRICTITDSPDSPLALFGTNNIYLPFNDVGALNLENYSVVFLIFEVIIFQYAYCNSENTEKTLQRQHDYNVQFDILEVNVNSREDLD